jgi:hypothetical protein
MRKNKWVLIPMLGLAIFNLAACAQSPHQKNLQYVKDVQQAERSTVLLNNRPQLIPLQGLEKLKVASIHFQYQFAAPFDSLLNKYTLVDSFNGNDYTGTKTIANLADDLKMYNTIIMELTEDDLANAQLIGFITSAQKLKNVVTVVFGNGKNLGKINYINSPLIWSEKVTPVSAAFCAQGIFGGVAFTQKLSKTFSAQYPEGSGYITSKTRLSYTVPEEAGVNADNLTGIDKVAYEAIREHATPGCVVLVAKDGKVIFNKAYGYHTYQNTQPDKLNDIFDLASVTKVSATNMEAMRLYDQNKLGL